MHASTTIRGILSHPVPILQAKPVSNDPIALHPRAEELPNKNNWRNSPNPTARKSENPSLSPLPYSYISIHIVRRSLGCRITTCNKQKNSQSSLIVRSLCETVERKVDCFGVFHGGIQRCIFWSRMVYRVEVLLLTARASLKILRM